MATERLTPAQREMLALALGNEANPMWRSRGAWVERYAEPPFNHRTGEALIRKGLMRQSTRHISGSYSSHTSYGFEITDAGRAAMTPKKVA